MSFQPLFSLVTVIVVALVLAAICVIGYRRGIATAPVRQVAIRWSVRGAMVAVLTLIALGPSIPHDEVDTYSSGVEIYFVVDRTGSMAAEDYVLSADPEEPPGTRLDGVRKDMREIVEAYVGARYSIISFDSVASQQLPLSSDARAVLAWTDTVRQEQTIYSQGSLIDRPLNSMARALTTSVEDNPTHERLVFFFSDGENTADGTPASFAGLADAVDGGAVLGYGTEAGGRMKVYDPSGVESGYITDPTQDGDPEALSVMDAGSLRSVADQLKIDYLHRTGETDLAESLGEIDPSFAVTETHRTVRVYQLLLWPFALAGAILLIVELAGMTRRIAKPVGVTSGG